MKKILLICILCGMMFVGCSEKSSSDNSNVTSTVTTLESTESTTVTTTKTTKETTDITTAVTTVVTTIPTETTAPAKEEVQTEAEVINAEKPQEPIAPTPSEPEKSAATAAPTVTPAPTPTQPAVATTVAPTPTKRLDENFKAELVAYIQDYCNSSGLVYRDDGNTPDNSSWDIPVRTFNYISNDEIKSAVKTSAKMVLNGYGQSTVINLYFEDDSQASGEWRIYVLV